MKKTLWMLSLIVTSCLANAADSRDFVLDKITYQVSAREWVSTQTALLNVSVNASLGNEDLVSARNKIMENLNKIAVGDWHLTQFDRSQDNSGLEKLYVQAQARVNQTNLTAVFKNAKSLSKPGAAYAVSSIEFQPSLEELQVVKSKLREKLYSQINEELAQINKMYTSQNYSVAKLIFVDGASIQPQAYLSREMLNTMVSSSAPAAVAVSNELTMSAIVEVASNRKEGE